MYYHVRKYKEKFPQPVVTKEEFENHLNYFKIQPNLTPDSPGEFKYFENGELVLEATLEDQAKFVIDSHPDLKPYENNLLNADWSDPEFVRMIAQDSIGAIFQWVNEHS